ncbi:MAG: competence protein ComEC [Gammaproteobacteria bacterium]|jgi:competence protein ComEC
MRTGCMFFLAGIVCLLHTPVLPPVYLVCLLPLCLFLGFRFPKVAWPMWFICGILWGVFRADVVLQTKLLPELENRHLTVEGVIVSLPDRLNGGRRFILDVHRLLDEKGIEQPHPGKLRLNWFGVKQALVPGDHWRLRVKLKQPHGFINPGGFDYEAWLFQQRIRATGYVSRKTGNLQIKDGSAYYLHRLRYLMAEKLKQVLNGRDSGSLIPALVLGDRSAIHADQWRVLTATGTSHLLAISGLHIGLVAGMVFFLTRWIWPLGRVTALLMPAPKMASLTAMLAAFAYAAMAGFSVPTQRALIMLLILFATMFISRKVVASSIISLALLIVLLIDPLAALSAGFWLSFAAISVIAFGMSARINNSGLWWRWGRVQYLVAVGLLPFLVLWFQQIPILSTGANLLVVPWVSFVTVPIVLLASILIWWNESIGAWLLQRGTDSIDLFWPLLNFLAELDFSVLSLNQPSLAGLVAATIGILLLLMPRGLPGRWLGFLWLLPLFFPLQEKIETGEFRLTLLDVGQGLSAVLETANHVVLFDTGPRFSSRFDAGSAVIIPFLRQKRINRINLLVQSHGDNDHIGGLSNIQKRMSIDRILTSVPEQITHDNVEECLLGQSWIWDEISFEILHPAPNSEFSGNDRSCVLKVSHGDTAILFTGDIEAAAEKRILKRDIEKLSSNILLAPHHGSRSSSTRRFIRAVKPEYVLFAVGYGNRFGFPKQDIIERYQKASVNILDTARNGAIEMYLDGSGITVRTYRQYAQRFWNINY